jgi:hypothetical protein
LVAVVSAFRLGPIDQSCGAGYLETPGRVQAASLAESTARSRAAIWFQLVKCGSPNAVYMDSSRVSARKISIRAIAKASPGEAAAVEKNLKHDVQRTRASHYILLGHQEGADWDYLPEDGRRAA